MRREIMKKAHKDARNNNTMSYRDALSAALKRIHWMIKHENQILSDAWIM